MPRTRTEVATRPRPAFRRGVATSECALILPVILVVTFGTVEACVATFLKESVTIAAYEGARVAVQKGAKVSDVQARVTAVLQDRGVSVESLGGVNPTTVSPDPTTAALLDPITVTVRVPCAGNTLIPGVHFFRRYAGRELQASVVMRKEYE